MENIDVKTLFVAITKEQAVDLQEGRAVMPIEPSNRFRCRETREAATEGQILP